MFISSRTIIKFLIKFKKLVLKKKNFTFQKIILSVYSFKVHIFSDRTPKLLREIFQVSSFVKGRFLTLIVNRFLSIFLKMILFIYTFTKYHVWELFLNLSLKSFIFFEEKRKLEISIKLYLLNISFERFNHLLFIKNNVS